MLLYAQADATDVVDVLLLLNQLALRFKDALAPVMQVGCAVPAGLCLLWPVTSFVWPGVGQHMKAQMLCT